tara:strand:- start:499 stop:687 length:189 start_codon:yes stop_codon:yes gene_type:complete
MYDEFKIIFNKVYRNNDHIATIRFNKLIVYKNKEDLISKRYMNKLSIKLNIEIKNGKMDNFE